MKKGWSWVKSKFNQHKGKIYEVAKKHGAAAAKHVGSRVLEVGKKAGKQVMDRAVQVAERNVEHYVGKAEKKIQGLADKAEFHISQYDRPPKKGNGVFSQQFKRRARAGTRAGISAGVQAFRRQR
jgi:gas vesicle protein